MEIISSLKYFIIKRWLVKRTLPDYWYDSRSTLCPGKLGWSWNGLA